MRSSLHTTDIPSNFVTVSVHLFADDMPQHLRPLISIYTASFFSLPVVRLDGQRLSFEDVVTLLNKDTIEYNIGVGHPLHEDVKIAFRVQKSKYREAVKWISDLLFNAEFDVDRSVYLSAHA